MKVLVIVLSLLASGCVARGVNIIPDYLYCKGKGSIAGQGLGGAMLTIECGDGLTIRTKPSLDD